MGCEWHVLYNKDYSLSSQCIYVAICNFLKSYYLVSFHSACTVGDKVRIEIGSQPNANIPDDFVVIDPAKDGPLPADKPVTITQYVLWLFLLFYGVCIGSPSQHIFPQSALG